MASRRAKAKDESVLPTIWKVPDPLWAEIEQLLAKYDPPAKIGRKRIDQRKALDGVIHHLRSGCQWNALPACFGDDASVHRTFTRWVKSGVLEAVWGVLICECEELGGVDWHWQSADAVLGKARHGSMADGITDPDQKGAFAAKMTRRLSRMRRSARTRRIAASVARNAAS